MFKAANVGTVDRMLRILIGAVLIALPYVTTWALWNDAMYRFGLPIVGAVLVVTALVRFCPLYRIIGASTCARS